MDPVLRKWNKRFFHSFIHSLNSFLFPDHSYLTVLLALSCFPVLLVLLSCPVLTFLSILSSWIFPSAITTPSVLLWIFCFVCYLIQGFMKLLLPLSCLPCSGTSLHSVLCSLVFFWFYPVVLLPLCCLGSSNCSVRSYLSRLSSPFCLTLLSFPNTSVLPFLSQFY